MNILIKNGHILDPATKTEGIFDILVSDGKICVIDKDIKGAVDEVIDASDCYVMPGLIDLHTHLCEPGYTHLESIESGTNAAAAGGYTTICAMPKTKPVMDNVDTIGLVMDKAKEALVNVCAIGSITVGLEGEYMTDIESLSDSGVVAICDDDKTVMNSRLLRQAMRLAAFKELPVFSHCEDHTLAARGVMNAGEKAKSLNLYGIMNAVEDTIIARDIILAKNTGAKLHICTCSTADSVDMIDIAKKSGISVTAEVTPHHLILCEDDISTDDGNYKVNPPLRTDKDRQSLLRGLKEGIIDVIATDHTPVAAEDKNKSMKDAQQGFSGLETALPIVYTELVNKGIITPMQMVEKMSLNPAKIIGIDKGSIAVGKAADIVIFNPTVSYTLKSKEFMSKGKNTPFDNRSVKGKVIATICKGNIVYSF